MGCINSSQRQGVITLTSLVEHDPQGVHNDGFCTGDESTHRLHTEEGGKDAIAIVGIGCRTAGADNIREFWRVLVNGECHVTDVPANRWNASAYFSEDPTAIGKAYVQKGGFINDVEGFDNGLYGINDYEASQMDPQQCLLLECTTMALQDAGITTKDIAKSNTGVYIGSMNNDYGSKFIGKTTKVDGYTATGISNTILASRLSYTFNLTGPCMVLDTACSASLVAVHQGCLAIRTGDCDMAICGGVNCMLTPDMFVTLSKARMISPSGLCHTFSDQADGYTRGEGCGVVILKRLSDAIRDGDNIRAVVYTGTNQDGHDVTPMTAPSGEQQKKLLHSVYNKYGIDVSEVDYIEAHGTGTPAGDPVEVNSLGSFFREKGPPRERHIGSVKTNIGHTESAAGVLALIKVLLMMEYDMIVPSLHCEVVNHRIDLPGHGFSIPKDPVPWSKPQKLAACNSFGFGGSNSHAVVRSYTRHDSRPSRQKKPRCIVCFSGKTQKALKNSLIDFCKDEEVALLDVHDVSYTSTARHDHHPFRKGFIVKDVDHLIADVEQQLSSDDWAPPAPGHLNLVFVFCGMGTAWEGMCRQLLEDHQVFRDAMLEVEKHLSAFVPWSLTERLRQEDPSKDPLLAPIATFACQVGLAAVWRNLGVQPSCVVGQSIGEIAAAYTAGSLSLSDAVKIIYHRSKLLVEVTGGAMIVVQNMEVNKVRHVLKGMDNASIALEYSPRACAISADPETMVNVRSQLRSVQKDMTLVDLDVHVAYHSSYVSKAADRLKKLIDGVTPRLPEIRLLSTVTGHIVKAPIQSDHWVDNVKKPVLFHQAMVNSVPSKPATSTVFLEVGPRPVLQAHMHDLFPNGQHKAIPSIRAQSEMKCLYHSIARLYELGVDIDWKSLPTYGSQVTAVPRYSFDKKHLKEKTEQEIVQYTGCNTYRKNHLYVYPTEESTESFRVLLSPLTIPSVYQHVVMGSIVVPGALYAECGFAIARYVYTHTNVSVSVEFQQLLPLKKDEVAGLEILPTGSPSDAAEKQFVICRKERKLAVVQVREVEVKPRELFNLNTVRSKCTEEANKANIYSSLRKFGFEYGPAFSLLKHAYSNSSECLATLELHDIVVSEMADTVIHPCVLDCMLQSTVLILGSNDIAVKEMLPKSIGELAVIRSMEPMMYVHARLKFAGSNVFLFDIQLLSADGHVIIELTDLAIQALNSQEKKALPSMLTVHWDKVKDVSLNTLAEEAEEQQRNLLLISEHELSGENSRVTYLTYDSNSTTGNYREDLETLLTTHEVEAVVVLTPADDYATKGADAIQSQLINLCLLLQSLFTTLNERSLRTPVVLLTFSAWPCPSGSQVRDVNPTATALWGLHRTVTDEHVYSDIVAVDLHIEAGDLNSQSLQKLVKILMTEEDLADYPEVLFTETSVYVNQVFPLSGSSVLLPEKRQNLPTRLDDFNGRAIVLSKEACKVDRPSVVSQETESFSKPQGMLKARIFALPSVKLFNMKMSLAHLFPDRRGQSTDYVVMALEVTGHIKETPGQELTSCGPMTVSPELSVCMDTTLCTASLPHYQAGDLSKLVLFWSLVNKVPTKRFSVLASTDTKHMAELVKVLSCNATERNESDVNIVLIENMKDNVRYHESVLSLVLLDVDTMSMVARDWKVTHSLISLTSLVTKDLQAYMACVLPDTRLCLLDTQLLFQQCHLKDVIPSIKEWIQTNTDLMLIVSQHLHSTCVADYGGGIHDLLHFCTLNLPTLSVRLVSDKLFRKDGAYIVIGGLTGLGWLCVEFLAQNNAGFIAIVNRRTPSHEQRASMENLACQFGCQIKCFQGDVSAMKSLQEILKLLSDEWSEKGHLRGVFTGAAVLQDGFFPTMERPAFEHVLSPKVKGTWNLHQLTKDLSLDYFVMHSSVASVLGNLGQANYATGNAFLDGLAFHRRYLGLTAQTINWGPLETGLLDNQDKLKQRLDSMGFRLITKPEIKELLPALMLLNWTQSMPISLNKELYANRMRGTGLPCLLKRLHHLLSGNSEIDTKGYELDKVDKMRFLQPPYRVEAYEGFLQELVCRILSVDIAQVSREVSLFDLGLDSVTGMMMVSLIDRATSFKLSAVSVLSGDVTVTFLAHILDEFAGEAVEECTS